MISFVILIIVDIVEVLLGILAIELIIY